MNSRIAIQLWRASRRMPPSWPLLAAAALLSLASLPATRADTTVLISGIGTSVTSDSVAIDTHVESVTYSDPEEKVIHGMSAYEIRGTVAGVGWGGGTGGIVKRVINAHYRYEIPFVARWRKHRACDRLVFHHHGGGMDLMGAVIRDKLNAGKNTNRFAELSGDRLTGVPALLDGATYISINRRGLKGDGTFSARYLPPIAPLDASEVAWIEKILNATDGQAGFVQPGVAVGAPVPALPTNDAPTCRDIARALERVVGGIQCKRFRTRLATGSSSGARLLGALNFGRSASLGSSLPTGGNHVIPYDSSSPRIFDAFILHGFTYIAGVEHAEPSAPLSAPTMFIQGQGDERYQQHVTMAHELLHKKVSLNGCVWLYEIKNLTHVTRDVQESPEPSDGDLLGCFMSAAIGNLRAYFERGIRPPPSRMAGRIVGGALRFDQAGGTTTDIAPVSHAPALDAVQVAPNLKLQTIGEPEMMRWRSVTSALPRVADAIAPPTVVCRLGGYKLTFFGARLVPFPPEKLNATYGSFACYRQCVCRIVNDLTAQRLYDPRVESAMATAELARPLFGP